MATPVDSAHWTHDRDFGSVELDWATAPGWVVIGVSTFLWVRATAGALAIRNLIGDYEAANGPISIRDGNVYDGGGLGIKSPALRELDRALVDTADYFYPFGVAILVVVAAIWCGGAAAAVRHQPPSSSIGSSMGGRSSRRSVPMETPRAIMPARRQRSPRHLSLRSFTL
ncbi:MAG: hypothetical protein GY698_12375 [Actinomycetia bacterium]|nr:hypothetical protein [Actinomycetes bacterium]